MLPELISFFYRNLMDVCVCVCHIVMRGNITYSTVQFRDAASKRPIVLHRAYSLTTNRSLGVTFSTGTSFQAEQFWLRP